MERLPWPSNGAPDHLLEQVLELLPAGVFTVDPRGTVTSWNRALEEISGFTAEEMIGASCQKLAGSACCLESCDADSVLPCPMFRDGEVRARRCTIRRKDGARVTILKNARPVRDDRGNLLGGMEALVDLSEVVALERRLEGLQDACGRGEIVGRHPRMRELENLIQVAGSTSCSVLITGETGTGKELVARAIHRASDRREGPFVRVSCAALPDTLLESELFGHVRGAFTNAVRDRKGRFEEAHGGTLLLDEIGDASLAVQTRLLRVLQEREFERVGSNVPVRVDIRVIAATNQDLLELADRGAFRRELYYRIAAIPIHVPALRERTGDVPLLVRHLLARLGPDRGITARALEMLEAHAWPGNIRELEHAVEYGAALARGGDIDEEHLPPSLRSPAPRRRGHDRESLELAAREAGGNHSLAARRLGISRVTLWKWLKKLHQEDAGGRPPG